MRRCLFSLFAFVAATTAVGCIHRPAAPEARTEVHDEDRAASLAQQMRNTDVKWDGQMFGLTPEIIGAAPAELDALGDAAVQSLLRALHDPERYAVAHVLLTLIAAEPYLADEEQWNGLRVALHADGRVELFPENIPMLVEKWDAWARNHAVADARHSKTRGGKDEPPHAGDVEPAKKSSFSQRYAEKRAAYLADPTVALPSSSPYSDRPELHAVYAESYQHAFLWASELESPYGIFDSIRGLIGKERAAARGADAGRWNGYNLRGRLIDAIRAEDLAAVRGGHN